MFFLRFNVASRLRNYGKNLRTFRKSAGTNCLENEDVRPHEDNPAYYDRFIKKGRYTDQNITVGGFKVYSDGALGSRGACLLHDYSDKKDWKGFLLSDRKHFENLAKRIKNSNLQMATHAIGDSANRTILQIYGQVLGAKNDRRWRIEHAQILDKKDFDLFGKYSVIPSVQPTHATSDMYWAEDRLGKERLQYSYAYEDLLKQNGWLPLGTDFPVEEINPVKTFFAAVARKDAKNFPANGFQKENALPREQAMRGMTIWAAKAAFQENEIGSLETGKSADFIIVNQDLMTVPEEQILETKVLETYSNGKKVF
ncbi:amidohydrolase [Kaistella sp. 97-N-M2]|uniref:amidohydrolase n=1 Tax=Kaistella sp. 97-N-M2 TaxID=2908645 RepID=UPI0021A6BA57|nr:amidohydrolase family protein [Kaistella sp. 97-N-M2]